MQTNIDEYFSQIKMLEFKGENLLELIFQESYFYSLEKSDGIYKGLLAFLASYL